MLAAAVVLAALLAWGALTLSRVQDALQSLTGRSGSIVDSMALLFPFFGPADNLEPSVPDFSFTDVSDIDLEFVRERSPSELTTGLPEFRGTLNGTEAESPPPDPNRVNFLLLGIRGAGDSRGGLLSDAILVVSLDQRTGQTAVISFPRDLYVSIPEAGGNYKINAAYAIGETRFGRGLDLAMQTVARTAGIPIHYGVRIDMDGFETLVDALGGIDVRVRRDFVGTEREDISIQRGLVHMDGETVLAYVRSRKSTDDFDRSRRQREVLKGIKRSLAATKNPLKFIDLLEITSQNVRTTLSPAEIRWLLSEYGSRELEDPTEVAFDTSRVGLLQAMRSEHGEYILVPRTGDFSELRRAVLTVFSLDRTEDPAN